MDLLLSRSYLRFNRVGQLGSENYLLALTSFIVVGKLIPFLRSPVWITTGFGAKFSGPGGTNFECEGYYSNQCNRLLTNADSKEEIAEFNADPEAYTQYARDVEGELNKRFTLVSL